MDIKRLLSFVLASTGSLSSSFAARRNFNNNLLGDNIKLMTSGNGHLKKNKVRRVDTSKARLNSDESVSKSMEYDGRNKKGQEKKVVNSATEKNFQVNSENLRKSKVDSGKSLKDKLLLGGGITISSLVGLGLIGWGAFEIYCKKMAKNDFDRLTLSLCSVDNNIYQLELKTCSEETYNTYYNYLYFFHDSDHSYVACFDSNLAGFKGLATFKSLLNDFVSELKREAFDIFEGEEIVKIDDDYIRSAAKKFVFDLSRLGRREYDNFIEGECKDMFANMFFAKIVDLFKEKVVVSKKIENIVVSKKYDQLIHSIVEPATGSLFMIFEL